MLISTLRSLQKAQQCINLTIAEVAIHECKFLVFLTIGLKSLLILMGNSMRSSAQVLIKVNVAFFGLLQKFL